MGFLEIILGNVTVKLIFDILLYYILFLYPRFEQNIEFKFKF